MILPIYYGSILIATILCSTIYIFIWHKHFNLNICLIMTFIPIACLGHFMYSISNDMSEAIAAQKEIYLGSTFLQLFILLCITNLCHIGINKWIRTLVFIICTLTFIASITIGKADIFYRNNSFQIKDGISILSREYGWGHTAYYFIVVLFFLAGLFTIIYSWNAKKQVPRTIILLLLIPYLILDILQ